MSKKLRTIIIDDEELARLRLLRLLNKHRDLIEIIEEADNGEDGLNKVNELKPDLIFLDIEMPVYNGFEMLERLQHLPRVIFTTAYDQYAIKAFEEDSLDYLLKPVEPERLERTIKKLERVNAQKEQNIPLQALLSQVNSRRERKSLTVKIGDRILLIKPEDIAYIQAEDKYLFLHCADGKKHLCDFTLVSLEEKLAESFLRISRSTLINTAHIAEIRKGFNGSFAFLMNDSEHTKLNSSRRYGEALRTFLEI